MKKLALVLMFLVVFAAGYVTGSVQTKKAMAIELGGVGQTVESVKNLGTAVVQMQKNVDELQKNLNSVKKIKEDLSGAVGGGTGQSQDLKKAIPQF
ncbi:MAG: hypothetical protein WA666_04700 [Nitrospirota bacterium]